MAPDEPDQTTPSVEPTPEPTPSPAVEVAPEQEPVVSAEPVEFQKAHPRTGVVASGSYRM